MRHVIQVKYLKDAGGKPLTDAGKVKALLLSGAVVTMNENGINIGTETHKLIVPDGTSSATAWIDTPDDLPTTRSKLRTAGLVD